MVSRLAQRKFTVSEAQVITGLSKRQINNLVDDLSEAGLGVVQAGSRMRTIAYAGLFALPLCQELAEMNIGPDVREALIKSALEHPRKVSVQVPNSNLFYSVKPIRDRIKEGLHTLCEAEEYIVRDSDILQGEPCLKGTRIPAYMVAALAKEQSVKNIQKAYPSLTLEQIEAARIYATAHPRQGRPKQVQIPTKSKKTIKLKKAQTRDKKQKS